MDHSDIHPEKQRSFVTSALSSTPTRQAANPHRRNGGGTVKPTAVHAVRKRPKAAPNIPKQLRPQVIGRSPVATIKTGSEPSFRWSGNDGSVVPNILKNHKQQYTKSTLTVNNTEQNLKEIPPIFPPSAPGQLHRDRSLKAPISQKSAFSSASVDHDHLALVRPVPQEIVNSALDRPLPPSLQQRRPPGHVTAAKSENSANLFIGDMDRTWEVFERLDVTSAVAATLPGGVSYADAAEAATKSEQFMSRLDRWGNDDIGKDESGEYRRLPFGGFLQAHRTEGELAGELAELGAPADWADPELFAELDARYVAETVFLRKWLPKCAPFPRNDSYRTFLRALNKRDPAFNLVW